jgi:photosystem II stability/assembly factor-like uncharacterized protein
MRDKADAGIQGEVTSGLASGSGRSDLVMVGGAGDDLGRGTEKAERPDGKARMRRFSVERDLRRSYRLLFGVGLLMAVVSCTGGTRSNPTASSTSPPTSSAEGPTVTSEPTTTTVALKVGAPVSIADLQAFEFLSADRGVALAFGDRIAATADSGRTWRVAGSPLPTGSGESWTNLTFTSPMAGFVYGNDVASTTDGGTTWTVARLTAPSSNASIVGVQAVGSSVWALVACLGQGAGDEPPCRDHLAVSADAGRSWSTLATGPMLLGDTGTLSRVNARLAYVHATSPDQEDGPGIAITEDGGSTWSYRKDPCTGGIGEVLIGRTHSDVWMFCAGSPSAGQQLKQIFRSSDQARHWSAVVNHLSPADSGAFPGSGYLNDMEVVSATTAWVALYRGGVWVSRDGGHRWAEAPIRGTELLADQISFTDPTHGWAREDGVLWRTTDGRHWTPLNQRSSP